MTQAVYNMIRLFEKNPGLKITVVPGSPSHPHLDPNNSDNVRKYVIGPSPVDGVYFNRLIINHYGGTAPLTNGSAASIPQH
jgi:hypothetical protein